MTAKLEWRGYSLYLGPFRLGEIQKHSLAWYGWRVFTEPVWLEMHDHESEEAAKAACESEVRRLLTEAGVEVS